MLTVQVSCCTLLFLGVTAGFSPPRSTEDRGADDRRRKYYQGFAHGSQSPQKGRNLGNTKETLLSPCGFQSSQAIVRDTVDAVGG